MLGARLSGSVVDAGLPLAVVRVPAEASVLGGLEPAARPGFQGSASESAIDWMKDQNTGTAGWKAD